MADCKDCKHFREAPYEAPATGCWLDKNMEASQKDPVLDQQQKPGRHDKINARGDCPDFASRAAPASVWKRLFSVGA